MIARPPFTGFFKPATAGTPAGPSAIANIWEWWEPSRESYANNDPISTLTGQFAAKNFTSSGTQRPTYKTGILNGMAVADFNSTNSQNMSGPNASALTAGHLFFVLKAANDPGVITQNTPWWIGTDGTNADIWPFSDGKVYMGAGRTTRFTTNVDPTPSLAAWRVLEVVTTSTEYTVLLDGSTLATTATNTVGFRNGIGLGTGPSGQFFTGQEAGLYIFSAKLGSTDRGTLISYLNTRFGLSAV